MLDHRARIAGDHLDPDAGRLQPLHRPRRAFLGRVDEDAIAGEDQPAFIAVRDRLPPRRWLPGDAEQPQPLRGAVIMQRLQPAPQRIVQRNEHARAVLGLGAQRQHGLGRALDDLDPLAGLFRQHRDTAPLEVEGPLIELGPAVQRMAGGVEQQCLV